MSEGVAKKSWKIDGMTMAGVAIAVLVLGFAIGFPAWLGNVCSAPQKMEQITHGWFTIGGEKREASSADHEKPPISQFAFDETIPAPISEYNRAYGTYYAPKELDEWGRQFWCGVNASDYFIALFTLVLAAVTGFLWWSTHRLWAGTEQQGRNFVLSQRANIVSRGVFPTPWGEPGAPPEKKIGVGFSISWVCTGPATAKDVCSVVDVICIPATADVVIPYHPMPDPVGDIGPNIPVTSAIKAVTNENLDQTWADLKKIYLWGRCEYGDEYVGIYPGLGRKKIEICYEVQLLRNPREMVKGSLANDFFTYRPTAFRIAKNTESK